VSPIDALWLLRQTIQGRQPHKQTSPSRFGKGLTLFLRSLGGPDPLGSPIIKSTTSGAEPRRVPFSWFLAPSWKGCDTPLSIACFVSALPTFWARGPMISPGSRVVDVDRGRRDLGLDPTGRPRSRASRNSRASLSSEPLRLAEFCRCLLHRKLLGNSKF